MSPTALIAPLQSFFRVLWQPLYGPPTAPSALPGRRREFGELLSLTFCVCLVLFVVKVFIAYRDLHNAAMPPQIFTGQVPVSLGRVWVCTAEDFAVGLGCVLLGGLGLRLLSSPGWRRLLRVLAHLSAALAVAYMIINAQIFHVVRAFLTFHLFQMGGGFSPEKSVAQNVPVSAKAALAVVPLFTLALHFQLFARCTRFWCGVPRYVCRPLVLLVLIGGLSGVSLAGQQVLFAYHFRGDFGQSPHLLLARSLFWRADFGDVGPEPPETADFLPGRPRLSGLAVAKRPTNVIVIVCESLGASYCRLNGYPQETTPYLSRLAARGLTFDNFYANNNHTIASAMPLFTATWNDPQTYATVVEYPQFPLIYAAEWMQKQGYRTAFLAAGGWAAWENYRNLAAFAGTGFDLGRDRNHPFWQDLDGRRGFWDDDYGDDDLFADARRVVRESAGKGKFFLMMWNYDTHYPYIHGSGPDWDPRLVPAGLDQWQSAGFRHYLNGIHYTDALIGAFYDELERLGIADETLVIVTGDHGEAFGQHGTMTHGHALYEEEVHVPLLLINRPLAEAAGARSTAVGSHIDLWPTIADVCGLPCDPHWQGRSLLGSAEDRRAFFSRREQAGLREGRYKYVWDHETSREWLFDLEADPGERTNLAADQHDYCLRQRRRLRDWTVFQTGLTKERVLEVTRP